jgi:ABC-2 type transport system permease protein
MTTAISYEWVRLRTLRSTWWIAAGFTAASAIAAWAYAGVILGVQATGVAVAAGEALVLILSKSSFVPLAAGLLGVFAVGGEYRHGTMRTTLVVTPRRTAALAAKAMVVGGFAVAVMLMNLVVAWLVGSLVLADAVSLSAPVADLVQVLLAQVLLVIGWALFGIALATTTRSQLFALAGLFAIPFAVEPMIRTAGLLSGQAWLERVSGFLPFTAGAAMADISDGAGALLAPAAGRVDPLVGGAVFFGVIGLAAVAAVLRFRHQDA